MLSALLVCILLEPLPETIGCLNDPFESWSWIMLIYYEFWREFDYPEETSLLILSIW